jgi:hypothetical protein
MAINIAPSPPPDSRGVGYWTDFLEALDDVIAYVEANNESDDSHDDSSSSSDSSEVDNTFDPDVNTVTEFRAAVVAIRASISAVI